MEREGIQERPKGSADVPVNPPGDELPSRQPAEKGAPAGRRVTLKMLRQLGQTSVAETPAESNIHTITIIGQVEGHIVLPPKNKTTKYEHIIPQLVAVEQNPKIKGLLVILNTVGGDVEAGLAIAEMLESMTKPTVSLVLGGGHSIGLPIAVACRHSIAAETATITIHPLRLSGGTIIGVPQTFEYMEKMQDRIVRFVTRHSRISEQRYKELMYRTGDLVRDVGSIILGRDAVNEGLIKEVGGLGMAVSRMNDMVASHQPSVPRGGLQ